VSILIEIPNDVHPTDVDQWERRILIMDQI